MVNNNPVNKWDSYGLEYIIPMPDTSDGLNWFEGAYLFYTKIGGVIHVPFSTIDVGWGLSDFGIDPCTYSRGIHDISIRKQYELYKLDFKSAFISGGSGNIDFKLKGELKVDKCKWVFKGTVSAPYNDFDFHPGNREWWKETIVFLVIQEQRIGLGKDFTVEFDGARPIEASGDCRK